jgi:hypothetical protein
LAQQIATPHLKKAQNNSIFSKIVPNPAQPITCVAGFESFVHLCSCFHKTSSIIRPPLLAGAQAPRAAPLFYNLVVKPGLSDPHYPSGPRPHFLPSLRALPPSHPAIRIPQSAFRNSHSEIRIPKFAFRNSHSEIRNGRWATAQVPLTNHSSTLPNCSSTFRKC